jgi:hypothetical protein
MDKQRAEQMLMVQQETDEGSLVYSQTEVSGLISPERQQDIGTVDSSDTEFAVENKG